MRKHNEDVYFQQKRFLVNAIADSTTVTNCKKWLWCADSTWARILLQNESILSHTWKMTVLKELHCSCRGPRTKVVVCGPYSYRHCLEGTQWPWDRLRRTRSFVVVRNRSGHPVTVICAAFYCLPWHTKSNNHSLRHLDVHTFFLEQTIFRDEWAYWLVILCIRYA